MKIFKETSRLQDFQVEVQKGLFSLEERAGNTTAEVGFSFR
jgi:hypothetical protein